MGVAGRATRPHPGATIRKGSNMTDFVLEVRSFGGIVAGARHFRGTVKGPHPQSCHGGTTFHGGSGLTTCAEGHEIPRRTEWLVESEWPEDRYERWAASQFEGDGPGQFLDEKALAEAARRRFLGAADRGWWDEHYEPGQPGDRLYWEVLPEQVIPDDQVEERWVRHDAERREQGLLVGGDLVCEVPQAEDGARFYVTVVRNQGTKSQRTGRLLGPYLTRAEAEGLVDTARRLAQAEDPKTAFDAFGVSRWERPVKSGAWPPGVLNGRLEAERSEDAAMRAVYRQLDEQDLPGDQPLDVKAGLRDLTARMRRETEAGQ